MTASERGARGELGGRRHWSPAGPEPAPCDPVPVAPDAPAPPFPAAPDGSSEVPGPFPSCRPPEWHPAAAMSRSVTTRIERRRTAPLAGCARDAFTAVNAPVTATGRDS